MGEQTTLPAHLVQNVGGVIEIDAMDRPSSNAYVSVYNSSGTAIVENATATIQTISTVLNGAVARRATDITVSNAANINNGDTFWIRKPDEKVCAKTISGNTVSLWSPLLYAHANNVVVEGTMLSCAVNASTASTLFWDGRAKWYADGEFLDYTAVDCGLYPLKRKATSQDVFDVDPMISTILPSSFNIERALDVAHAEVLKRMAGEQRIRVFTGSMEFRRATAIACIRQVYLSQTGEEAERMYKRYSEELEAEIMRITRIVPRDENQDGFVSGNEVYRHMTVRLVR